ncbi:hypothetical protein ACI2JA_03875 [Alkalihalobacillus sp. NPDC078783]
MSYYNNQDTKVAMMGILKEKGWNVFGYKADESDSMTDYFSPAYWDGIAECNGYVLLVDVYSTSMSGHQVTKSDYKVDYSKIRKLEAMRDDKASSENEKRSCDVQIKRMYDKEAKNIKVISEYPVFSQSNPKGSSWHIEKDGEIIAKGTGVFSCYESNDKGLMNQKLNKVIDRIEKKINESTKLVKKIVTETKTVIKPVETGSKTIAVGDLVQFGNAVCFYEVTDIQDRWIDFIRLGKKMQKLKNTGANFKRYTLTSISRGLESDYIKAYSLQEVTEIAEKVVYVKEERAKEQTKAEVKAVQIESSEDVKTTEENKKYKTNEVDEVDAVSIAVGTGTKGNGIELTFASIPSEEARTELKEMGYKWNRRTKVWWAIETPDRLEFAKKLATPNDNDTNDNEKEQADKEVEETSDPVAVESITFNWSESPFIDEGLTVSSFSEANTLIKKAARDIHSGYDKTEFVVTWKDGRQHEGRIDITSSLHAHIENPLGEHIVHWYESISGNRKPSGRSQDEYINHLQSIYSIGEKEMLDYKNLLSSHLYSDRIERAVFSTA